MTKSSIAKYLVARKNVSNVILLGETRNALGFEGYALAFNEGWIVPDYDGSVKITENQGLLRTLNELAQKPDYKIGDRVVVVEDGTPYTGAVKTIRPDGTFELSFEPNNGPKVARAYQRTEVTPSEEPSTADRVRNRFFPQAAKPVTATRMDPRAPAVSQSRGLGSVYGDGV